MSIKIIEIWTPGACALLMCAAVVRCCGAMLPQIPFLNLAGWGSTYQQATEVSARQ